MKWQGKIVEVYDLWWSRDTEEELPFWVRTCAEYIRENRLKGGVLSSTLSILQSGIARMGFAGQAVVRIFECWVVKTTFKKSISLIACHLLDCILQTPKMDKVELRIVELCSGTGRILIPLVQALQENFPLMKITATGLDYSPDMNKKFLEKLELAPNIRDTITVKEYDLRNAGWNCVLGNEPVNIFILPLNHLGLMGDPASQENLVLNVSRHLAPGGCIVDPKVKTKNRPTLRWIFLLSK